MNLLSYNYFVYFNYVLSAALVVLPWVFNPGDTTTNIVISIIAVILFFILASSKQVKFPATEFLAPRIIVISLFVVAIILPFLHILLKFTDVTMLLWLTYAISTLQLLSIIFTDLTKIES